MTSEVAESRHEDAAGDTEFDRESDARSSASSDPERAEDERAEDVDPDGGPAVDSMTSADSASADSISADSAATHSTSADLADLMGTDSASTDSASVDSMAVESMGTDVMTVTPSVGPVPEESWQDLQGRFVDDPQAVVKEAGALIEKDLATLRNRLEQGDTENLRVAFRRYRDLHSNLR